MKTAVRPNPKSHPKKVGRPLDSTQSIRHPITKEVIEPVTLHKDFMGDQGAYAALTVQLRRAVDVLVMGGTGIDAARAAGYGECSYSALGVHGHVIRRKPEVIAAIKEREAFAMEEAGLTPIRSWTETRRIAYFDPAELFDTNKRLKHVNELSDNARAAIQSIEIETRYEEGKKGKSVRVDVAKIKFWNKVEALTMHLKASGQIKTGSMDGALVINNNTQINNLDAATERVVNAANPTDASIEYQTLMGMVPAIEHKP